MKHLLPRPCAFPGCTQKQPHLFCQAHWQHVRQPTRRLLVDELKHHTSLGRKKPSVLLEELATEAVSDIKRAVSEAA